MRFRLLCVTMLLLAACSGNSPALQSATIEALVTPTLAPTDVPVIPAPETTPESALALSIWLPDTISPANNQAATLMMASQIDGFQASEPTITVQTRLKKIDGKGGLMTTLLSASDVAPAALPDLTLIRREDLRAAVQAGLIQALDGRISTTLLQDFYGAAQRLGQLNGKLYGLAYALEIQHIAYQSPSANFSHFDNVLNGERPFVFPAGQVAGISDVFLTQYVAAGGTLVNGNLGTVNVEALRAVLSFYEQAVAAGLVDPGVLNYPAPEDYQAGLVDERIGAAVVTSGMYLDLLASGKELETAPIPLLSGEPSTLVDGWMWVMTAKNPERQAAALQFLTWMFDANRHGAYTRAVNMLPSTRTALRGWGSPRAYTEFAGTLLSNAILPLLDNQDSTAARELQNALIAVLSGERTAEEATQDVIDQLAG